MAQTLAQAEPACTAMLELAQATADNSTMIAVRSYMLGTVCTRLSVSSCPANPSVPSPQLAPPTFGPSCQELLMTGRCMRRKQPDVRADADLEAALEAMRLLGAGAESTCGEVVRAMEAEARAAGCHVGSGFVGLQIAPEPLGLRVTHIVERGGAEAAGVRVGDIVTAIDGAATAGSTLEEAIPLLRGDPGSEVTLTINRESQEIQVRVTRQSPP